MATRLSQIDWIQAGFRALTVNGPQAVKAEVIARDLKVSKGSFYWHFENMPAFRDAMLAHWVALATDAVMADVDAQHADPKEQLRVLTKAMTTDISKPYGGMLVESAIRDWGRFDSAVSKVVGEVEDTRLKYLAGLFRRAGASATISRRYANIIYSALIGLEYLSHENLAKLKADLPALMELLLATLEKQEKP